MFDDDQIEEAEKQGLPLVRLAIDTSHLVPDGKFFELSGPAPAWVADRVRELVDDWKESVMVQRKGEFH